MKHHGGWLGAWVQTGRIITSIPQDSGQVARARALGCDGGRLGRL